MLIDISQLKFIKDVYGVIHIGAHDCEERMLYLSKFHNVTDNEIIWIDALKSKVDMIKTQTPNIRICNECISNTDNETVIFHITNNLQSSSFLKLKEHLIEHPDIYEIQQIEMKTKTLKTFYNENNFNYNQFNFMALDIQGTELLALKGAEEILNHIDYIYLNVNTKELYEKCALLDDVDSYLTQFNFSIQTIYMTEHGWGDAFYVKNIHNISPNFKIEYGIDNVKTDVTEILLQRKNNNSIFHIPTGDESRSSIFGDPIYGKVKTIFVTNGNDRYNIEVDDVAYIDTNENKLYINNEISLEPSQLITYKCPYKKYRLGQDYDGGYIIADIPNINYTILLAGGIENDISFEEDFIKKYPNTNCFAFDGTICKLPKENPNINFIKKNIGFENNEYITNLHDIINNNENIFVKMDIEGGEIPWIKSLNNEQMNKFQQIVIEFHFPFSSNEVDIFNKINKNHNLIHFHGNNACGLRNHKGVNIPNVFECTYLHKKYFFNIPELSTELIPSILDMKNLKEYDEIYINYPPFVYVNNIPNFKIEYGTDNVKTDVTEILLQRKNNNSIFHIPTGDESRSSMFGDPIYGKVKTIFVTNGNHRYHIEVDDFAYIDMNENKLYINEYYGNNINTAVIVEPRLLKNLSFIINDYYKKLGKGWKIVFYCGEGLQNIWLDLLNNRNIEIRELKKNCYNYNEYCDFIKSKELWENLYGEYVLLFTANSTIINQPPYTIDYFMSLNKSYIGGNQNYLWNELSIENIYPQYNNFQGGLSLRKRLDMIKIIDTLNIHDNYKILQYPEDIYFTIGCYKLGLPVGDDEASSHFSVHNYIPYNGFFGVNNIEPYIFLLIVNIYEILYEDVHILLSIQDIENEVLVINNAGGFFSNCTVRLFYIIMYFNYMKKIPLFIDNSKQFELYKYGTNMNDVTYEYFLHNNNFDYTITYENPIDFRELYQFTDYTKLNYNKLTPFIKKYFSPTPQIENKIRFIENKYNIANYDNICVLFLRGNDKITEFKLPSYNDYIEKARLLYNENPNIKFLIQSDEIEFIERMILEFPNNSFYFKDEIRTIHKCDNLMTAYKEKEKNFEYAKIYLAITIIMSKCKYIVCSTGNCSLWILLYRGNADNLYQY